MKSEWKHVAVN